MENKIRYTLGKKERLKSRKAIDHLFKEGSSFSIFPFRIIYIVKEDHPLPGKNPAGTTSSGLRAGFTVSSRNFRKSVDRNRVKRLMREAWRLQKNEFRQLLELNKKNGVVFFIFVGKELPGYKLVHDKTAIVLQRLIKLTRENR